MTLIRGGEGAHLSQALRDTNDGAKQKWAGLEKVHREGPLDNVIRHKAGSECVGRCFSGKMQDCF